MLEDIDPAITKLVESDQADIGCMAAFGGGGDGDKPAELYGNPIPVSVDFDPPLAEARASERRATRARATLPHNVVAALPLRGVVFRFLAVFWFTFATRDALVPSPVTSTPVGVRRPVRAVSGSVSRPRASGGITRAP